MKKMFVINPDGKYTVNPTENPRYNDMVVYHTDEGNLKIEAPATGYFSSAEQRKTVNDLAGKWLESKSAKIGEGDGEVSIQENKCNVAEGISVVYIIATVDGGKLSKDEAIAGAGLIGEWVGKTAKKDTAKKPAPAATTAKPAANSAPATVAPAADTKATPPATDSKPAGTKATPPAADPAPATVAPATKSSGVHWDPNLSVDENIERLWNAG